MKMTGMKVAAFDIGGTLLRPRDGDWYLTEPVKAFLRAGNFSPDAVAEAVSCAKKATAAEIRADTVEEELRIYTHFYRVMTERLSGKPDLSEDELRKFSLYRASAPERFELNRPALEHIRLIRGRITTVLFSNTWPSVIRFLRDENVTELFSYGLFSCETGLKKPDSRFFDLLPARTGCRPEEIILYDDSLHVTAAAGSLGFRARLITFDTLETTLIDDFGEDRE